jgi:hypothetical protein
VCVCARTRAVLPNTQWDVYLKLAGMEESRIAIARGSKYGEGEAIQTITMSPELDEMTIEHSTMGMYTWETGIDRSKRSKSSIKIHRCEDPDSPQVVKEVMSEGICKDGVARVSAQWEADRLVMRCVKTPLPHSPPPPANQRLPPNPSVG